MLLVSLCLKVVSSHLAASTMKLKTKYSLL
jgi:hypothetical protein